ncbi:MAG: aminomethyltransferase [Candidatus Binatia bacterium]|nr:MAG: aminomethyltransferase [Candidatus Binatia bacterium]
MPVESERTTRRAALIASGAVLGTAQDGGEEALHFGDWKREWAAVREGVGVFDGGFRKLWALVGTDRVSFLQGMITADVARLGNGTGTYAASVTVQGRVVTDLRVFALEDALWLDVPRERADRVREHLSQYIVADDVEFADPPSVPLIVLEGRRAASLAQRWLGEDVAELPMYGHREIVWNGLNVRVAAVTHTGERGWILFGSPAGFAHLWQEACALGALPVGAQALEVLRIEAGIPRVGVDMDESTLIAEADVEAAISYGKGCYLGQEVVERVAARGQVQRKRRGFICRGSALPVRGAGVFQHQREVGHVTSVAWSPALGCGIGFAYLRREVWEPGQILEARWAEDRASIEVANVPFLELPVKLRGTAQ